MGEMRGSYGPRGPRTPRELPDDERDEFADAILALELAAQEEAQRRRVARGKFKPRDPGTTSLVERAQRTASVIAQQRGMVR